MWQCWATPLLFLLVISLIASKLIHSSLNLAQAYGICMHQNLLYIPFTAHLFTSFFPPQNQECWIWTTFSLPDLWLGWHCVFLTLFFFLTLLLFFFQSFSSHFDSSSSHYFTHYHYTSSNSSSPFLTFLLTIFFFISSYYYSFFNPSAPFFTFLLPIISHFTVTIPPIIPLLF